MAKSHFYGWRLAGCHTQPWHARRAESSPRARIGGFLLGAWLASSMLGRAETAPAEIQAYNIALDAAIKLPEAGKTAGKEASLAFLASGSAKATAIKPGQPLLIEWPEPRDVRKLRLHLEGEPFGNEELVVQWWHRVWPDNGQGGWQKLDDPFNGEWLRARTTARTEGNRVEWEMLPLDRTEAPTIKLEGFAFRHTYKLSLAFLRPARLRQVEVFSEAARKSARIRFEWNPDRLPARAPAPSFQARNAMIRGILNTSANAALVEVDYADATNRLSASRGFLVFRAGETNSFSVFIDDVLRHQVLRIRDLGALVSDGSRLFLPGQANLAAADRWPDGTVMEQVALRPEQSLAQVLQAMPAKPLADCLLGVPDLRQEFALSPNGDIRLLADSLRSPGPDLDRRPWQGSELAFRFSSQASPVFDAQAKGAVVRSLEEGWLPVVHHAWKTGDMEYEQISFATTLMDSIAGLRTRTGTEPVVLATRFHLRNTGPQKGTASLWLQSRPASWLRLGIDNTLVMDLASDAKRHPGLAAIRGRFNIHGRGALSLEQMPENSAAQGSTPPGLANRAGLQEGDLVKYRIELGPQETHAVDLLIPYIELLDVKEMAALKQMDYDRARQEVTGFWKQRISQGMTCQVPDPFLNDFFKASLWHVLISTDLDPETGLAQHGAATVQYKNFLNETVMVARALEMRGEHAEALKLLEPFLACQGVKGLPGNFKTKEGVFYAAHPSEPDPYTAQGYNMHHGWGLWGLAEHYLWTRDKLYLRQNAEALVKACQWIARERRATCQLNPDGSRPVEYGLAPAGDLEDVEEYLYFYATDAYYYLGLRTAASTLAEIQHPQAAELAREADAFLADLRASVAEATATSPVVPLRDGAFIPYVPPRAHALTHRKEGWIREGLYPALHLLGAGVYPYDHPFADWMIQDLEDNIFLSAESGYGVANPQANFFNLGGFTLQPNLLDLALVYLHRDQTPNFLRAFYNTAGASLYPDIRCFAEWIPSLGQGGGPLYKTPDECKFIQWLRSMLVLENNGGLELGLGIPAAWMVDGRQIKVERAATWHGLVNMEINSTLATNTVLATVSLAPNGPPVPVSIRLRHPEGKRILNALVNGAPAVINHKRQLIALPRSARQWQITAWF